MQHFSFEHWPANFWGLSEMSCARAAQRAAARSQPADAPRLLTGSDLLHLNADMEPFGEYLDQFAEVDALVGDIIEDGLDLVALVLHVADLHVQPHVGGDLTGGDHRLVLQRDGLLPAFDIVGFGLAVDLLELAVAGVESRAAHLARHQIARQRNDADIVAGRGLDRHDIAAFQRLVGRILIERPARILEAHLDDIVGQLGRIARQPRGFVQFEAAVGHLRLTFGFAVAEAAAASDLGDETEGMSLLVIHDDEK